MTFDITSKELLGFSRKKRIEIVKEEFRKCKNDFEYFLQRGYGKIRHPKEGIMTIDPFDFQSDIVIPLSYNLIEQKKTEARKRIEKYQNKFDYSKWLKEISEKNLDLVSHVPETFKNFYEVTFQSPLYDRNEDCIILKSRQTGISTIFQTLNAWHINFFTNIYDLVLSQTNREAKKYLGDVKTVRNLIPPALKSSIMKKNEHEFWLSLSGKQEHQSGLHALPPTKKAGRSYSPNLIVLDEFSEYENAFEVFTAISMTVSAGGILAIIATPKGVGNLFHMIWTMANKSLNFLIENNPLHLESKSEDLLSDDNLSSFKPHVVHWSQIPDEEFKRRGHDSPLHWYNFMKGKISIKGGEQAVAQELDLDFISSGNTIGATILKNMEKNICEIKNPFSITKINYPGVFIFEKPQKGKEYILGADCSEGIGEDSQSFHILKVPEEGEFPKVVAFFENNKMDRKIFSDYIRIFSKYYNNCFLNIEKNGPGDLVVQYLLDNENFDTDTLLMNKYSPMTHKFSKSEKGWDTQTKTRRYLLSLLISEIRNWEGEVSLPSNTYSQFLTFVQSQNNRWDALTGYHDDNIFSLAIAYLGVFHLEKYKLFLEEEGLFQEDIPSSLFLQDEHFEDTSFEKIQMEKELKERILKKQVKNQSFLEFIEDKPLTDNEEFLKKMNSKNIKQKTLKKITTHRFLTEATEIKENISVF